MPRIILPFAALLWSVLLSLPSFAMEVQRGPFGTTTDGEPVEVFTLTNAKGLRARVITWGATLVEMSVPDRNGKFADVTLGFDEPERYLKPNPFFGSIAGRYANRIGRGQFTLDGKTFALAVNNGPNHLHGGKRGFDKRIWKAEILEPSARSSGPAVRFTYVSPDGEEGYPGTLTVSVTYTLADDDRLSLAYTATTDKPTVVNLTNHAYWNLSGEPDILGHELEIHASSFTVADGDCLPTGEIKPVADSPLDFQKPKLVGKDIAAMKDAPGGGYDHNYIVAGRTASGLAHCATLRSPTSGRAMTVYTDQPGVQFYTGNHLQGVRGKAGVTYSKFGGLCLETQHYPDSPNQPAFPSTVLRLGETFQTTTVYGFSVEK